MSLVKRLLKSTWLLKAVLRAEWSLKRAIVRRYRDKKKYFPQQSVNAPVQNLIYCMLCPNMCRFDCPAVQASKRETHSPATKARIAYYLEMNRLEKNAENILPLFEGCAHCAGCEVWCPFDFSVGDLLEGVAADLFSEGVLPKSIKQFSQRIHENNGLYSSDKFHSAFKTLKSFTEGEIYYFPGCLTMAHNSKAISAIVKISEIADVPLLSKPEERWCCGAPLIYAGDLEKAKELAQHNKQHFHSLGVKAIVCECPKCAYTLKEQYPKLGFDTKIPVLHISEWLFLLFKEGKITISSSEEQSSRIAQNSPVSFHDPCVLARKLGVIDAPRELLRQMFPEIYKEIPYSGKYTHCCGFGGLVNIANPKIAGEMSKRRLAEFAKAGIKTIVTSCPTCRYSFMKYDIDLQFEVIDLVEIVASMITKPRDV